MSARGKPLRMRQWRVTITEERGGKRLAVNLAWRTFPCKADEWHGARAAGVDYPEGPIDSPDGVAAVLYAAATGAWAATPARTHAPDSLQLSLF